MTKKAFSLPLLGIAILLVLDLLGELYRFHGILLLDLFVPIFTGTWLFTKLLQKKPILLPPHFFHALLFFLFGLSSLFIHAQGMSTGEVLEAAFYGVRFAGFYLLSILAWNEETTQKKIIFTMLLAFTLLLSLAGFVQLGIMPSFRSMEDLGWDPHENRLLSTWFDPNFVGGFLAFMTPLIWASALEKPHLRKFLIPLALLVLLALGLTLSRSAYLALIVSSIVFGLLKSVKSLALAALAGVLMIFFLSPVQSRFLSLVESAESTFVEDYTLPDASARLRFGSWEEAWQIFLEEPLLGQGYNRYKYAALEIGTLKDLGIHSASGSDSSLLNVLATTGIVGFLCFFGTYLTLAKMAWKNRAGAYSSGFFSSLCGLFIHSIFVNSLLFPLFMAPFWLAAGLLKPESPSADR